MREIILIDDNKNGYRKVYGASFVDDDVYGFLTHKEKVNEETDFSFITDAACVMVHESLPDFDGIKYTDSGRSAVSCIKKVLKGTDIKRVWFSDGREKTIWEEDKPNVAYVIKEEFYRNLKPFLENYKNTGEVDLRIIAYGSNYMECLMEQWYDKVISKLVGFSEEEVVRNDERMMVDGNLEKFIENADLNVSFEFVEDKISEGSYTVKELIDKLNKIMSNVRHENSSFWE